MSDEKKPTIARVFHGSLLVLGSVVALNIAVAFLHPILPWLLGGMAIAAGVWVTVAVIRWRRSRW